MGCASSKPEGRLQHGAASGASATVTNAYSTSEKANNLKDDSDWVPTVDTDVYNVENGGPATVEDDGSGDKLVQM